MGFYCNFLTVAFLLTLLVDLASSSGSISLVGLDFYNIKSATPGCLYEGQHLQHSHDDCRYLECRQNHEAQERWCPPGLAVNRHRIHVVPTANPCTIRRAKCTGYYSPALQGAEVSVQPTKFRYGHLAGEHHPASAPWWKSSEPKPTNFAADSQTFNGNPWAPAPHVNRIPGQEKPEERGDIFKNDHKTLPEELEALPHELDTLPNEPEAAFLPPRNSLTRGRRFRGRPLRHRGANRHKRKRFGKRRRFKFMKNKAKPEQHLSAPGVALPFTAGDTFDQSHFHNHFANKKFFPYAVRYQSPNLDYLETVYSALLTTI